MAAVTTPPRGGAGLLVLEAAVAEAAEPVEGDGAGEAGAGLALAQPGGDEPAQCGLLGPAQGEERARDAPDLERGRGERVLLPVGRQRTDG